MLFYLLPKGIVVHDSPFASSVLNAIRRQTESWLPVSGGLSFWSIRKSSATTSRTQLNPFLTSSILKRRDTLSAGQWHSRLAASSFRRHGNLSIFWFALLVESKSNFAKECHRYSWQPFIFKPTRKLWDLGEGDLKWSDQSMCNRCPSTPMTSM